MSGATGREWLSPQMTVAAGGKVMDYFGAMKSFVRCVDLGSFSKAAEESGMKVSTVSRHISALEEDLGAALFNRTTRRLNLTEAGQTFYQHATQILADVDAARQSTSSLNAGPNGLLRIHIPGAFGRRHVMPHMTDFLSAYPDIRLDATLTDTPVDVIETGADVAVRFGSLADSSLIARRLVLQRRLLVATPAYLARKERPTIPDDLHGHECLFFALTAASNAWYHRPLDDPQSPSTAIALAGNLRSNDQDALRAAVLDDLGIALLPTWLIGDDVQAGRLTPLLTDREWLIAPGAERMIWAIYPPKKVVPPKVRAFLDFLIDRFGDPPYWDRL